MAQSLVVSQEEMDKQRQCAARVREGFPGRTYKIVTYGCQMNAHDSENLAGMLEEMGFAPAADEGEADLLLFNTCCIRDNAERRLLGNVSALAQRKREKPDLLVGVCGCMMQQEGGAQRLLDLCPFVDLVFGTHNLYRLPELLRALDGVVPRIRFMTSHPKDLSDALIEEMARSRSVCPQFHLPVQSGNDKVLREMNRVYTRAHYLERVRALRQAIPEVGLTTDVIAGFPGETEAEFADTLSLVEEVQYDSAFTFIYSPRRGTRAAARPDQIPEAVQHERLDRLIRVQERATASRLAQQVGSVQEVLVEGASRRREGFLAGRTGRGMTVNFPGDAALVGRIVPVRILGTGANTLRGERA